MTKRFAKRDIWFLMILAVVLGVICVAFYLNQGETGSRVEVQIDGEVYGTYLLSVNQEVTIEIDGEVTNLLMIEDGVAKMMEADCPDQLCVHQKAISKDNETIVCLPNKVVVQVISDTESEFDSIAK